MATAMSTESAITSSSQPAVSASPDEPNAAGGPRELLQPVMDLIRVQSREFRSALRLQRDIFVDGWAGRFDDLSEQIAEDKRQARAHVHRASYAVRERMNERRDRRARERAGAPTTFPQFTLLPAEIRLQIWEEALPGSRAVILRSPYTTADTLLSELRLIVPHIRSREALVDENNDDSNSSVTVVEAATADSTTASATTANTAKTATATTNRFSKSRTKSLGWTSPTPPPALLHACHESRTVGLKRYELVLACHQGSQPRIYADLSRDVVCLSRAEVSPRCAALWRRTADLDRIRHLAVAGCPWTASSSSTHGASEGFAQSLPPRELLQSKFVALEDVVVVRSVRWQYGRLPGGAARDFDRWARREEAAEGLERWYTRWRDGAMVIRGGRRKSMELGDGGPEEQQADGQVEADQ